MKPSLCLNMIVKNEAARIDRCLNSIFPYVKAAYIYDTGSTDGTIDKIRAASAEHDVPTIILAGEFVSFGFARNVAWQFAKEKNGQEGRSFCQFALMMDADMEFVDDGDAIPELMALDANAASYDMMQKGGSISYANRRIVNLNVAKDDLYAGSTHEYIDVPANGMIKSARFIDHADGSNRVEKYPRDEKLLLADLNKDPNNARAMFYLANTYRDWGKFEQAANWYQRRIEAGGWDEEVHAAMMALAHCHNALGDKEKFVAKLVEAYSFRPQRAEPLYDLAKHYRESNHPAAALIYTKAGVDKPRPDDVLFVNDYVYSHGLRYEHSVVGFYDEVERPRAFELTNSLALDPDCPTAARLSSRSNLYWYTRPIADYCPSFKPVKLDYHDADGYQPLNPSIEVFEDTITCNLRLVNYRIDENGRYVILDGGEPIRTRNMLFNLDPGSLLPLDQTELLWDRPEAKWNMVMGLEDIRLWRYQSELHFTATVREMSAAGVCQIGMGRIIHDDKDPNFARVADFEIISDETTYEKNWMPMPPEPYGYPQFMYRCDVVKKADPRRTTTKTPVDVAVGEISGSSQLIPFRGGLIGIVHEASTGPDGKRTYWHRFAWWDYNNKLRRLSVPFVFFSRQIEFCAGLAMHPNKTDFIISFGVRDAEAWLATVDATEVSGLLWKFYED